MLLRDTQGCCVSFVFLIFGFPAAHDLVVVFVYCFSLGHLLSGVDWV